MLKLLRKDLILNGRVLGWTYGLWSVLWLGLPVLRPGGDAAFDAGAGMVSLACAFLPVMMIMREDKFKAGALACSLPVRRDSIVASRYVGGWIVGLAGAAVAAIAMGVLSAAGLTDLTSPTLWLPVVVIAVVGIVLAVLLPFALRFGITGVLGFLIVSQLLGIVLLLASAMFGGVGGLRTVIRGVAGAVGWARGTLGPAGFSMAVVAAVIAANLASYRLSVWIYRRRDF